MPGLCGAIGPTTDGLDQVKDGLQVRASQRSSTYREDRLSIAYVDHATRFEDQPATIQGPPVHLWAWGTILGHDDGKRYTRRSPETPVTTFLTELYREHGPDFVEGLNSEFSGVILDRDAETVTVFTDRLAACPLYHTRLEDGTLLFASLIPALGNHPDLELRIDPNHVSQFLAYSRTLGTQTPVHGVHAQAPATTVTYDLEGNHLREDTFWQPRVRTKNRSFSATVERLQQTLSTTVADRAARHDDQGLLLSGGTDSRALLAAHPGPVTAFHMNEDPSNPEAQIAKTVADQRDETYRFLERGPDYHERVLEEAAPLLCFNGLYHSAKAIGFADEITQDTDALFCGHYADSVIGTAYVPQDHPLPGLLGSSRIVTPESYVDAFLEDKMRGYNGEISYLDEEVPSPREILEANIHESPEGPISHGVQYPTWASLRGFGMIYPLRNTRTFVNYETLAHTIPTHYPFLDNRLLDLVLETPERQRYARDPVRQAVRHLDPSLARIPHASTGIPLTRPRLLEKLSTAKDLAKRSLQQALPSIAGQDGNKTPPRTHTDPGSWMNHEGLLRAHPFLEDILARHEKALQAARFLDAQEAWRCYHEHQEGEDHTYALFALLTLLETPVRLSSSPARNPSDPATQKTTSDPRSDEI